jgi:hypothetical protein
MGIDIVSPSLPSSHQVLTSSPSNIRLIRYNNQTLHTLLFPFSRRRLSDRFGIIYNPRLTHGLRPYTHFIPIYIRLSTTRDKFSISKRWREVDRVGSEWGERSVYTNMGSHLWFFIFDESAGISPTLLFHFYFFDNRCYCYSYSARNAKTDLINPTSYIYLHD